MKKNRSYYFLTVFTILRVVLFSQNETKIWYFGNKAGLDFNTSPPTILTNGVLGFTNQEGSASIADSQGNLLFYTDGVTIWDKTHSIMANGSGLLGNQSTTQAALIIKQPGTTNIYYVFTLDAQGGANGLQYSVVDMSLSLGNGSVTIKNTLLFTPSEEKLTAARHSNGVDTWILSHDFTSGNFRAYLLTASGVNTTAIISTVGSVHDGGTFTMHGYLKVSPDGKKIGAAIQGMNTCELYDFNSSTGILSNHLILTNTLIAAYGCEFSPDGTKFYAGGINDTILFQWNLCAGSGSSIVQSQTVIYISQFPVAAMQLAPDGKIYVARYPQQWLGVINNPNIQGTLCNYVELGQSVAPKVNVLGLPNFDNSLFYAGPTLTISALPSFSSCAGETLVLSATGANTYTWNSSLFGSTVSISPTITSSFTVIGTNTATGCRFDALVKVSVSPCTSLNELEKGESITIYPNPVQNSFKIQLIQNSSNSIDFENGSELILLNSQGKIVKKETLYFENDEMELDTSELQDGIYNILIKTKTELLSKKIIIVKP